MIEFHSELDLFSSLRNDGLSGDILKEFMDHWMQLSRGKPLSFNYQVAIYSNVNFKMEECCNFLRGMPRDSWQVPALEGISLKVPAQPVASPSCSQ